MGRSRNAFLQLAVWSRLSDFCSTLTSVCLRFSLCKRLYALNCVWKRKWCNLHRTFTTKKKMSVQTSAFPQSFLSFPQTAASLDLLCVRKTEDLSIYLLSTTLVSSQKHGRIQLHGDWGPDTAPLLFQSSQSDIKRCRGGCVTCASVHGAGNEPCSDTKRPNGTGTERYWSSLICMRTWDTQAG